MDTFKLLHFVDDEGGGEYVVIADGDDDPDDHKIAGYRHADEVEIIGNCMPFPCGVPLFPQR